MRPVPRDRAPGDPRAGRSRGRCDQEPSSVSALPTDPFRTGCLAPARRAMQVGGRRWRENRAGVKAGDRCCREDGLVILPRSRGETVARVVASRRARDFPDRHNPHIDPTVNRYTRQTEPGRPGLIDPPGPDQATRKKLDDLDRGHPQLHAAKLTGPTAEDRRRTSAPRARRDRRARYCASWSAPPRAGMSATGQRCRRQASPPHISARGAGRSTDYAGPDRPPQALGKLDLSLRSG
jgi:hypothetical protein